MAESAGARLVNAALSRPASPQGDGAPPPDVEAIAESDAGAETPPPGDDAPRPPRRPAAWSEADLGLLKAVYDLLRTSRMNAIYHGCRLGNLQRINFWMEVVTAATASGSGLAAFLDAGPMKPVWQTLSLTAATIAVAKPIYAPGKRIEVFTRQQQGYHANYFALRKLAFLVQQEGGISVEHKRRYDTAYDRHVQLSTEDEASPRMAYVARARAQTNQELPSTSLWWPASAPEQTAVADPANPPPPPPSNGRRALVAAPLELASPPWFNRFAAGTSAVGAALLIWLAVGPGSAIDGWIGKSGRTSAVDRPTQAEPSGAPDQPTGG